MHPLPLTCMLSALMAATVTAQNQLEPASDNEGVLGVMYIISETTTSMYNVSQTDITYIGTGGEAPRDLGRHPISVVYGKLIYIILDHTRPDDVSEMVYNSDTGIYTRIPRNIPPIFDITAMFIIDYRLYVVGKSLGGGNSQSIFESLSLHTIHNQNWRLETVALPPKTHHGKNGCALGQTAIVAGGYMGRNKGQTSHTYKWQPGQASWSRGQDMHDVRAHHCMVCADDHVWVIGGGNDFSGVVSSMERYSLARDEWEVMASLPQRRGGHQCVYDGAGRIIVIGGYGPDYLSQSNIVIYNMAQNTWTESHTSINNMSIDNVSAFIPN